MNLNDISCPAVWHLRTQNGTQKQRLFVCLILVILSGLLFVGYLQNAHYGWSGRVLSSADAHFLNEVNNEIVNDYGVVMDCGSSGTRVFVYTWPRASHEKELLEIEPLKDENGNAVQKKVEPGLSSFADHPEDLEEYLRPLIDLAIAHIPEEQHHETVLYMLATAGMRMIPQEAQDSILSELRASIPSMTNFVFSEQNVGVITGKEEGIYAWIAANYILGKLKFSKFGKQISSTGIIDMGGGSMQIAFEVPKDANISKHENLAHVSLGSTGLDYDLFVTTHLGFGANEALRRHIDTLPITDETISDPCFPVNFAGEINSKSISGTGEYESCYSSLKPLLEKSSCSANDETCSLAGTFQPSLTSVGEFFGFSEFYYTSEDTLKIAGLWDKEKFVEKASEYCATEWDHLEENWKAGMYKADENRLKNQCFKSAWVALVLHEGLNFPESGKKLTNVQTINGAEVQWALGALIYRTRYLPLRNAEPVGASTPSSHFVESRSNGFFFFCIGIIVLLSIAQYRRIHTTSRSNAYSRLPLSRPDSSVI